MDPIDRDFDNYDAYEDELLAEEAEQYDPELTSLAETADGQGLSLDSRDFTPSPPRYLNPRWVKRMQGRVRVYRETGRLDWMKRETKQGADHGA